MFLNNGAGKAQIIRHAVKGKKVLISYGGRSSSASKFFFFGGNKRWLNKVAAISKNCSST